MKNVMILENLHRIFQEEVELMTEALEVEKQKSMAILQAKTQLLKELTQKSDELLKEMIKIENQRYTLLENLFEQYKDRIQGMGMNLSSLIKIIETLKEETKDSIQKKKWEDNIESLITILKQFRDTTESLKSEVITNQKLLQRTKNIISNLIDQVEKKDQTYDLKKSKRINHSYLVNQSI